MPITKSGVSRFVRYHVFLLGVLLVLGIGLGYRKYRVDSMGEDRCSRLCQAKLRQFAIAIQVYSMTYGDGRFYPTTGNENEGIKSLQLLSSLVDIDLSYTRCPSSPTASRASNKLDELDSNYCYLNMLPADAAADCIVMYDKAPVHRRGSWLSPKYGRNVLLKDGQVLWLEESEFQRRLLRQRDHYGGH